MLSDEAEDGSDRGETEDLATAAIVGGGGDAEEPGDDADVTLDFIDSLSLCLCDRMKFMFFF